MDNSWRIKQQNGELKSDSDRSRRREWNRTFANFSKVRIKDKFWWKSLTEGERHSVYWSMVSDNGSIKKKSEYEMKKQFPGNISMKRNFIIDEITK
jgi:hypothetical protein